MSSGARVPGLGSFSQVAIPSQAVKLATYTHKNCMLHPKNPDAPSSATSLCHSQLT